MCDDVKNIGNGAVDGAEIDIFESHDTLLGGINHAIHWDGYGKYHKPLCKSNQNIQCYDGEYHTYSLVWDDEGYFFYIDGNESFRSTKDTPDFPGISERAAYLVISQEFGTWAGKYDPKQLPDSIYVDYVKVYQKA